MVDLGPPPSQPKPKLLAKLRQCSEQWREIVPVNQPKSLELRKSRFLGLCNHKQVHKLDSITNTLN